MASIPRDNVRPGCSGWVDKPTTGRPVHYQVLRKVAISLGNDWKELGRAMEIEEEELDSIEEVNKEKDPKEMAYKLLDVWKKRDSRQATAEALAGYLEEIEMPDLAEEILRMAKVPKISPIADVSISEKEETDVVKHSSQTQEFAHVCSGDQPQFHGPVIVGGTQNIHEAPLSEKEEKLKDVWQSLQASLNLKHEKLHIPKMPWLEDWEMNFEEYYVDLTITSKHSTKSLKHELTDIFQSNSGNIPTRILIEGPAGYGKSTLALKLCHDHAKGKEYIRQFEVVILLRLREFQENLDELITSTLDLKDHTPEEILEAIKRNESKVLFVLDGLDELAEDKHEDIVSLLSGKRLPQSTVIVTSRVGSIPLKNKKGGSSLPNVLNYMDSRIVIKGVTAENRRKFLQFYLHDSADKLKRIENPLKLVDKGKLFDCPLFLLLLVILIEEEDISKLTTKTELYKTLFNFMLRRMFAKEGDINPKCDFFDFDGNDPPSYVEMLRQFGSLAIRALYSYEYSFTSEEILSHCGNDNILKLGILTQNDSKCGVKRKSWFEPLHLTFLEFSAAYCISVSDMHALDTDLLFYTRFATQRYTSVEFLLSLCRSQCSDLCSKLGNGWNAETWLVKFIQFEKELKAERQLNYSDLAADLLPLVPKEIVLPKEEFSSLKYEISSILLKDTLALALRKKRMERLVLRNKCNMKRKERNSEGLIIYPIKVKRNSDKSDGKVKIWSEIITHQDLLIDESKSGFKIKQAENESCNKRYSFTFELIICEASLDHQLDWLSNWLSVEGFLLNKPIRKINYEIEGTAVDITETLCKITELIRKENVESVKIDRKIIGGIMHLEPWNDLVRSANQSKRLLDMEIYGYYSEKLLIDMSGSEEKTWRKIVLHYNVIPCVGPPLDDSVYVRHWDVESVVQTIPGCIEYLRVEKGLNQYVFVQNHSSTLRHLRELFIWDDKGLKQVCNWSDLQNVQVLAILYSDDIDPSILLSLVSRCHPRLRLELWTQYEYGLVGQFLLAMNESKWDERRKEKTPIKLDTLMLGHLIDVEKLSERSVKLMKDLLLSGQLGHLWLSGLENSRGCTTPEFIQQFSRAEGFDSKVRIWSEEDIHWDPIYKVDYYIEISAQKIK